MTYKQLASCSLVNCACMYFHGIVLAMMQEALGGWDQDLSIRKRAGITMGM